MSLFMKTKRWLRRRYPLPFPCRVYLRRRAVMDGAAGWFITTPKGGRILIDQNLSDSSKAETLLEEWAHAVRHASPVKVDYEREPHDAMFWAILGEITKDWRAAP
jgi:hypothetical protein